MCGNADIGVCGDDDSGVVGVKQIMAEQVAYNIDCMEYMKTVPDKYFDLAVVDPPYGGGANTAIDDPRGHFAGGHMKNYGYGVADNTHTHTHTHTHR